MLDLVKSRIEIGLDKPVKLLHVTDTHITHWDERNDDLKKKYCGPVENAEKIRQYFLETIEYCNENCDMMAHTGDLLNVVTYKSLEVVRDCFAKSKNYTVVAGNHEYSQFCGESWEDLAYKMNTYPLVRGILGFDLFFSAKQVGGVNVVGIDNGYYHVEPWQLWRLQREVEKGLPIVLMMHVPLFEEGLFQRVVAEHKIAYLMGCDEEHLDQFNDEFREIQQRPNEDDLRFIDYVYSQPLIKCVLAGHVHINYESMLPGGIPQLVTGLNCRGIAREIELY